MLSLVFSLVLAVIAALDQCPYCKPNALCPKHLEKEQAVLRDTKKALQSKVPAERSAALLEIASLNDEHVNAPSKRVAEVLALAVGDGPASVRQTAADLLAESRRPDVAFPALERALDDACSQALINPTDVEQHGDSRTSNYSPEKAKRAEEGRLLLVGLAGTVARLQDDRSVRILVDAFDRYSKVGINDTVARLARHLTTLGTRKALEPIIQAIERNERRYWKAKEDGRPAPSSAAFVESLHGALTALAEAKKLEGAPEWKPDAAGRWRVWLKKNQASFPKSLGTLEVGAAKPSKG
ncbi:MAG: hypothetical protein HYR85_15050 [Planctomycetes bacterium]|nr:hypothetical protein [Planctomycetota bacterium]MBI3846022.1 hypothetical protein [Planctomycetota bacterium]